MTIKPFLVVAALLATALPGRGQGFTIVNRALNQDAPGVIHMSEAPGDGIAWIKGQEFTTGTVEVDIKGRDLLQQSFVGMAFHGENDSTFEVIYFRPFNFRNTDTVRRGHSVQYVALPRYDWSMLREKFPNKYEQPIANAPDPNDWFHARIVVTTDKISVFVNGQTKPSLVVAPPLVHGAGRQIGYWVGNGSNGDFKNLRVSK